MSNVVAFPSRDDANIVWRCNCGCITHFVRADGEIECAQCGALAVDTGHDGEWRCRLPETPAEPQECSPGDFKVTDLNSSEAAFRRVLRNADPEQAAVLIVLNTDGSLSAWGTLETEEQREWFDRRMAEAKALLARKGGK